MDDYQTAAAAAADLRNEASDLWRQAEVDEEQGQDALAMARRDWANERRDEAKRLETDPEYAAQMEAKWNPVETGVPALQPHEVTRETVPQVGTTSTGHTFVSGYGHLTAKRLAHALGYSLTAPRPVGTPSSRPREHRPTHRPRARAPGGDDSDPSQGSIAQQVLLAVEPASPILLLHIIDLLLIRCRWLMTGRRCGQ